MRKHSLAAGLAGVMVILAGATPASASTMAGSTGADISWPQCSGSSNTANPSGAQFGIVGVNGGKPMEANSCYGSQMAWETGISAGYPVQVYLNTADPGNTVPDWPTAGTPPLATGYGSCILVKSRGAYVGADSQACAYMYGVQAAEYAQQVIATSSTPSVVWLDVETGNSWQSRSLQDMNEAVLDGMVDTLNGTGRIGAYSTHYQWNKILGKQLDPYSAGVLSNLIEWIPTGQSSATSSDCSNTSLYPTFTQGPLEYLQYTTTYDYDLACPTNDL